MNFYGGTDRGLVRPTNQDSYYVDADGLWAVVADGMGGHNGGEMASSMAVEIIRGVMESGGEMKTAVENANRQIFEKSLSEPKLAGMGTTVVLCRIDNGKTASFSHVGDSRAYLLNYGVLKQITKDHSIVQQLIESGTITKDQAKYHPQRNLITRAVGTEKDINIDFNRVNLAPGDVILICSDGLCAYVDESKISEIIRTTDGDETVGKLIEAANENGGKDNVTVVLIRA